MDVDDPDDITAPTQAGRRWPVRVWPGVLVVLAVAALMVVPGVVAPKTMLHFGAFFGGPALGAVLLIGWWTFASRARGRDRWLFPVLLLVPAVLLAATAFRAAPLFVPAYALPVMLLAWVGWLAVTPWLAAGPRRAGLAAVLLGGWAVLGLVRFDGADGNPRADARRPRRLSPGLTIQPRGGIGPTLRTFSGVFRMGLS